VPVDLLQGCWTKANQAPLGNQSPERSEICGEAKARLRRALWNPQGNSWKDFRALFWPDGGFQKAVLLFSSPRMGRWFAHN